jgi:hypothetical protein
MEMLAMHNRRAISARNARLMQDSVQDARSWRFSDATSQQNELQEDYFLFGVRFPCALSKRTGF